MESLVARLEKVAGRLEAVANGAGAPSSVAPTASTGSDGGNSSPSVAGYDAIVQGSLQAYLSASAAVGGDVQKHAGLVNAAFLAQREYIVMASKSKAPAADAVPALLADTSKALQAVSEFRESNRRSTQQNHLAAVSEGIPALGWVMVTPKPAPHIKEMIAACQFYSNRVLKDFKDSDPKQVAWAKSFVQVLEELHDYVKANHTTGLVWNAKGADAKAPASAPATAAPTVTAPAITAAPAAPAGDSVKANLFASLSEGGDGGFKLKKVDKSEMTHKNPALRASSVVPAEVTKPAAAVTAKPAAPAAKSPPVLELRDRKWVVEFQEGNKTIVIDKTDIRQTVYIYKCNNSTIQIKGKVNSITCDGCKKTAVVFDDCIGSFEFVNCQSMQVQVIGNLPIVSIDKTDGAQVYLSKASIGTNIITAKSSEMNILVPGETEGDFVEFPLPEQFKTTYDVNAKKFVTTINEIAG